MSIEETIKILLEGGIVGACLIFLLKWMLTRWEKSLEKIEKRIVVFSVSILTLQQVLIRHDLTVHGFNPSLGKDLEESAKLAITKYDALYAILEDLKTTVQREMQ